MYQETLVYNRPLWVVIILQIMPYFGELRGKDEMNTKTRKEEMFHLLRITESPLSTLGEWIVRHLSGIKETIDETYRKNNLLMKRSLLTGFLFFPFGTSVHI
jgi:hypothetical protein